jgi:hypothetical protein
MMITNEEIAYLKAQNEGHSGDARDGEHGK